MTAIRRIPLAQLDPEIDALIKSELKRQQTHLELIASENFTLPAIMEAQGSVLTNKYAEGYPGKRWYGGCEFVDTVEQLAQAILADASLTQRLLRLANSPLYRTRDAAPVTTVSRALVLLGFDQIRLDDAVDEEHRVAVGHQLLDGADVHHLAVDDGAAEVRRQHLLADSHGELAVEPVPRAHGEHALPRVDVARDAAQAQRPHVAQVREVRGRAARGEGHRCGGAARGGG
jgi:hypothetical protein